MPKNLNGQEVERAFQPSSDQYQITVDNVVRPWFEPSPNVQTVTIFNQNAIASNDIRIGRNSQALTATNGLLVAAATGKVFDQIDYWDTFDKRFKKRCELQDMMFAVRTGATSIECFVYVVFGAG